MYVCMYVHREWVGGHGKCQTGVERESRYMLNLAGGVRYA